MLFIESSSSVEGHSEVRGERAALRQSGHTLPSILGEPAFTSLV